MPLYSYHDTYPSISTHAFVSPSADIIGNVTVGSDSGIWFGCVVRGDVSSVHIGEGTNIQDGTIIHVTRNGHPTSIGDGVTVGHSVTLHACTLKDLCFIGMGAVIMDDVMVESGAMVAAGALVTPGKIVPKGQIWAGSPATYFRDLTEAETRHLTVSRDNYIVHAREYLNAEVCKLITPVQA